MADDTAVAVGANGRQCMDCTLEAIKGVTLSAYDDFKRLVIIVLADFAFRHTQFVRARGSQRRCLLSSRRKFGDPAGVFLLAILKQKFGVPSVLGIVSAVSLLGLVVTLILRREDTQ